MLPSIWEKDNCEFIKFLGHNNHLGSLRNGLAEKISKIQAVQL
jgi:hypothetical protein